MELKRENRRSKTSEMKNGKRKRIRNRSKKATGDSSADEVEGTAGSPGGRIPGHKKHKHEDEREEEEDDEGDIEEDESKEEEDYDDDDGDEGGDEEESYTVDEGTDDGHEQDEHLEEMVIQENAAKTFF